MFDSAYGVEPKIELIESHHMIKRIQFRYPRSKRLRVRKKWAKNACNFKNIPDTETLFRAGNMIIGHPVAIRKIRDAFRQVERDIADNFLRNSGACSSVNNTSSDDLYYLSGWPAKTPLEMKFKYKYGVNLTRRESLIKVSAI